MAEPTTVRVTHSCPCGCGGQVPRHQLACKPGWYRLPKELRDAINAAYRSRRRDPSGHLALIREALDWYRNNPRAGGR